VAAVPQWFTNEVARRLRNVKHMPGQLQHYACCPVPRHGDKHQSFAIRPGDTMPLIYYCQKDCEPGEIRDALAGLGVPDEYLGSYGTPEYQARKQARPPAAHREQLERLEKQIERMRWEMLELKASIRGLMNSELSLALMKIRILAVMEGVEVPVDEEGLYVAFAMRAGVPKPTAYRVWKTDPLVKARTPCVTPDHVVLAQPGDGSQARQVSEAGEIIESITPFSDRERSGYQSENASESNDYQNDNPGLDEAVETLRSAGMISRPSKPAA
jgi:hypothetical protein